MTISKGSGYGTPAELPPGAATAWTDAELANQLAKVDDGTQPVLGLAGGDLFQSLGGGPAPGGPTHSYPVDLGWCELEDGSRHWFAAHLIARGRMWHGSGAAVMNATQYTTLALKNVWNLGPKAHPNDGLLDITYGALRWQQMVLARPRVVLGTHLPHPDLTVRRTAGWSHEFARRRLVWADGQRIGRSSKITVGVRPDAGFVVLLRPPST